MKEAQKQKYRSLWRRFCTAALTYALLPMICGGVVALFLFLQSMGTAEAVSMLEKAGDQAIFMAIGGVRQVEKKSLGYYFLSPEVIPPLTGNLRTMVGLSHYLSPTEKEEAPEEPVPSVETVEKRYDALPANATPVVRADLSSSSYAINTTKYTVDPGKVRESAFPCSVKAQGDEPLVLVLHTHGTECYFEDNTNLSDFATDGVDSYFLQNETVFRTTDPSKSVVQVGKVFADTLNKKGIPTLHVTTMHDKEDFNSAYVNSAETVKAMLNEYPSIQYVIDLHRDSVVRGDAYVKSYTEINGVPSAQVMLVVGTNQNGRHPNWEQNLVVATAFRDSMDQKFPTLSRSLYLRTARFNQEYRAGCMLLEVGSAANTLAEAENAARFAAEAFAQMLKEQA